MQAKTRVWPAVLVVLILALFVAGCGGGNSGKTMFNLPSAKLTIQPNGTASFYGLPIPAAILQPAQIQQLQAADAQRVEARWDYDGIHALVNGGNLPSLAWDAESEQTLTDLVRKVPGLPQSNLIARVIPWLRSIGSGVRLDLPVAAGAASLDIPNWTPAASAAPAAAAPAESTVGPLDISSITFDEQGNAKFGNIPLSSLGAGVALPPSLMSMLNSLGITKVAIDTQPDGLHITLDDKPLPTLAYDSAALQRAVDLAKQFVADPSLAGTLDQVAAVLPGADVSVAVTFDGEPAGATDLSNLRVGLNADGSITALGLPLPVGAVVPPALLDQLAATGLQNVQLDLGGDGVKIVADSQPLPAISWSDAGLNLMTTLVPQLTGMPAAQIEGALDLVKETGLGLNLALPGADAAAAPAPAEFPGFTPVDLGDLNAPIINAALQVDAAGNVTQIGNIVMADVKSAGLPLPAITLPANVMDILKSTGAKQVGIVTNGQGHADITLDGQPALSLDFDAAALQKLLAVLKPLLNVALLDNPIVSQLLDTVVMPVAPGAKLNLTVALP